MRDALARPGHQPVEGTCATAEPQELPRRPRACVEGVFLRGGDPTAEDGSDALGGLVVGDHQFGPFLVPLQPADERPGEVRRRGGAGDARVGQFGARTRAERGHPALERVEQSGGASGLAQRRRKRDQEQEVVVDRDHLGSAARPSGPKRCQCTRPPGAARAVVVRRDVRHRRPWHASVSFLSQRSCAPAAGALLSVSLKGVHG